MYRLVACRRPLLSRGAAAGRSTPLAPQAPPRASRGPQRGRRRVLLVRFRRPLHPDGASGGAAAGRADGCGLGPLCRSCPRRDVQGAGAGAISEWSRRRVVCMSWHAACLILSIRRQRRRLHQTTASGSLSLRQRSRAPFCWAARRASACYQRRHARRATERGGA